MARVQLFSKPQQTLANKANSEYQEKENPAEKTMERSRLAPVSRMMPVQSLGLIFSLNRKKAKSEVVTISKLLNNETLPELELAIASIRNMEAIISSKTMPMAYLISLLPMFFSS